MFMLKSGLSECIFQHKIKHDVAALHSGANRFACLGGVLSAPPLRAVVKVALNPVIPA